MYCVCVQNCLDVCFSWKWAINNTERPERSGQGFNEKWVRCTATGCLEVFIPTLVFGCLMFNLTLESFINYKYIALTRILGKTCSLSHSQFKESFLVILKYYFHDSK